MSTVISALVLIVGVVGVALGRAIEARRWRGNADAIQRIESAGRLFKVERADG